MVYVREARTLYRQDQIPPDVPDVEISSTLEERCAFAATRMAAMELDAIPTVVDHLSDTVATLYRALPTRLFVIGRDGTIAYQGAPGPRGLDPDAWEAAIEAELRAL